MFATFDPFTRFLQRVSAQYGDWIDMRERLDIERHYSPLDAFVLFTDRERAMPALHLDGTLSCREIASARPIHDGYVSALEILNSKDGAPERALDAEGLLALAMEPNRFCAQMISVRRRSH